MFFQIPMHLSRITLTNVRQFEHRTFEFQPGFNLLVGENGAGKTTILRSLLAAMGGTQQLGRRPRLEDDDIRLRTRHAEVRTEIHLSNGSVEEPYIRKTLWERAQRSQRRDIPLILFYSSNESTCSGMKVKRPKQFGGLKNDEVRRGEEFLYESEMGLAQRPVPQNERRFGHSQSVRNFVGRILSTFSSDFGDFYWRFEPYDCALLLPDNSAMEQLTNVEIRNQARAFAMRYFQEGRLRRRKMLFEWPDQAKVILTPEFKERRPRDRYLPDLREIWDDMRISPEIRKALLSSSLEVKLTPRIMIRRQIGALSLDQLSDGEQRLFSLFVDIARQLSLQNPNEEIGSGQAIVLIDEIDVHLHPKWQRRIVPALEDLFHHCQFIATTHSPFVIQAVQGRKIQHLNKRLDETLPTQGIEEITVKVMGITDHDVSRRYLEMLDTAKEYFRVLESAREEKRPAQVKELKQRLNNLSNRYAENPAYQAYLEMHGQLVLGPDELR